MCSHCCCLGSDIWRLNSQRRQILAKQMPTLKVKLSDGGALEGGPEAPSLLPPAPQVFWERGEAPSPAVFQPLSYQSSAVRPVFKGQLLNNSYNSKGRGPGWSSAQQWCRDIGLHRSIQYALCHPAWLSLSSSKTPGFPLVGSQLIPDTDWTGLGQEFTPAQGRHP